MTFATLTTIAKTSVAQQPSPPAVLPPLPDAQPFVPPDDTQPMSPADFFQLFPNHTLPVAPYKTSDFDGDTISDALLPTTAVDNTGATVQALDVFSGWTGLQLYTVQSAEPNDLFSVSTAGVDDIDGDGVTDLLVGAMASDIGAVDAGRAYLFSGATGALLSTFTGSTADAAFGYVVSSAGDLDGDGLGDLMVSAPFDGPGKVYVFFSSSIIQAGGVFTPNLTTADADLVFMGEVAGDVFGFSLASAGDVDADGAPDIIIGAPFNDAETGIEEDNRGRVYIYSGGNGSLLGTVTGNIPSQFLGYSVSSAGDVNNDGKADIFMGAPDVPEFLGGGKAFIFYGVTIGAIGSPPTKNLCSNADIILSPNVPGGDANDSLFGLFVTLGNDVNRDGEDDLIVHAGARDALGAIVDTRAYVFSGADGSFLYSFATDDPLPPPPPDVPDDGTLDQLRLVLFNFGSQNATAADGDLNGDGVVDSLDLIIAIENLNNLESQDSGDATGSEDCLGIINPDGSSPCDDIEGSGGGGGILPPVDNGGTPWDPCADIVLPDPPLTVADCDQIAFCAAADAVKAAFNALVSQKEAAKDAEKTSRDAALLIWQGSTNPNVIVRTSPRALAERIRRDAIQGAIDDAIRHIKLAAKKDSAIAAVGIGGLFIPFTAPAAPFIIIYSGIDLTATLAGIRGDLNAAINGPNGANNTFVNQTPLRSEFLNMITNANVTLAIACEDLNMERDNLQSQFDEKMAMELANCLDML